MPENNKKKGKSNKKDKKTILVDANDIQTLVLHSVSELLDKGVLEETEDGKKIDLKQNTEDSKKKKGKSQDEGEGEDKDKEEKEQA
ncbi:MAG: hypothetical protein JSV49_11870 [Thermoplasmata archaeon]|nr:MAG: hypothetical protein JSV49_11870 [Thermoplasmata archaeon]